MNTVKKAQQVFLNLSKIMENDKLPIYDLMLIHSRYTFQDRREHEKRLIKNNNNGDIFDTVKNPKIRVSTQIVEVSLDINYDVLFIESCYFDSLVQRAGRIKRYGKLGNHGEGLVKVFLPQGDLPYESNMQNDFNKIFNLIPLMPVSNMILE